jgi:hypothetical protein
MFVWVVPLFAAICAWLWAPPAHACKCAEPEAAVAAAASAAAVFEGQVSRISAADADVMVELKVARAWKGVTAEQVSVRTRAESAACGYPFQAGQSYLVYAQADGSGLQVHHCGRTRPIEEAREDIVALGMGTVPVATQVPEETKHEPVNAVTAQQERPAAGGCASCSVVGSRSTRGAQLALGFFVLIGVWRRRRLR